MSEANVGSGSLGEGTEEVWLLDAALSLPRLALLVGKNTGGERSAVVTTKTDKHDTKARDIGLGHELVTVRLGSLFGLSLVPHGNLVFVTVLNDVF